MQSIRVRLRIGKDGLLQIQLPQAQEGTELDIILVYETASLNQNTTRLSDFYGCIQDGTFIRHPQPEQPEREAF
ncbi:hypothetical protein VB711_21255 [Cronbergia sp. UHCC 0137]|uniref:hypothetical protein n=1 Tax=Cronbergia sp. UHCC 0137 TaxID=3110239 RepID=UPI002B216835|nr:hypothetical protein [Cronbergia sp. UHCC 0137]MEA5620353.1 hypothetical protein [Cronbergia sp. UHCC 0137]